MAILERMSVEFGVVAKAIERLAPHPLPRSRRLFAGLRSMIFAGHRRPVILSQRWDAKFSNQMPRQLIFSVQMEILNQDGPA
jgi:hypothetical protein